MKYASVAGSILFLICCGPMLAEDNQASQHSYTISDSQVWTDTGVEISAGQSLRLSAENKSGSDSNCSPEGIQVIGGNFGDVPVSTLPAGALMAKIGENGEAVLVGKESTIHANAAGRLFLGVNLSHSISCVFSVKVDVTSAQTSAANSEHPKLKEQLSSAASVWLKGQLGVGASAKSATTENAVSGSENSATASSASTGLKLPSVILDADLRKHIDDLPRRVRDHLGNLGDMVNFVIIGSEDRAKAALEAADWHIADVDSKEAGLKAIMNTYERKDYLEMPMSHLYLFDRTQDFGYEQAQAFSVVASRHHFRMWKSAFTWNDETVWVGAGTHDVGFEKDIRTGHLTHKIDPDVDQERANIAQSLEKSGKIKNVAYYLPLNPIQDAKNASGGGYHSDGRLLVVFLK